MCSWSLPSLLVLGAFSLWPACCSRCLCGTGSQISSTPMSFALFHSVHICPPAIFQWPDSISKILFAVLKAEWYLDSFVLIQPPMRLGNEPLLIVWAPAQKVLLRMRPVVSILMVAPTAIEQLFCFRWLYYILSFYRSVIFVGIYITSVSRRWKLRDLKREQFLSRLWLIASAEAQSDSVHIRLVGLFHTPGARGHNVVYEGIRQFSIISPRILLFRIICQHFHELCKSIPHQFIDCPIKHPCFCSNSSLYGLSAQQFCPFQYDWLIPLYHRLWPNQHIVFFLYTPY